MYEEVGSEIHKKMLEQFETHEKSGEDMSRKSMQRIIREILRRNNMDGDLLFYPIFEEWNSEWERRKKEKEREKQTGIQIIKKKKKK